MIARAVLEGQSGAPRNMVLANAAAGLLITERVESLPEGVAKAAGAIDDGSAQAVLAHLAATSRSGSGGTA